MKNRRFFVGLTGVAAVVSYLMVTGVRDSMVYYMTPSELVARIDAEPAFRDVGVKVSGRVVEGSWRRMPGPAHEFSVADLADADVVFSVRFEDVVPDTFNDRAEVVLEGKFGLDGVFEARTVLTKCGSRYEAAKEDFAT